MDPWSHIIQILTFVEAWLYVTPDKDVLTGACKVNMCFSEVTCNHTR